MQQQQREGERENTHTHTHTHTCSLMYEQTVLSWVNSLALLPPSHLPSKENSTAGRLVAGDTMCLISLFYSRGYTSGNWTASLEKGLKMSVPFSLSVSLYN